MNLSTKPNVLLLLCLTLVAACGGGATSNSLTANVNPREDLTKAMRAQFDAKSYRAKSVSSSPNGAKSVTEVDYVAPDRFRVVVESNLFKPGSGQQEMIVLGRETYMKAADGQWQKIQRDMS